MKTIITLLIFISFCFRVHAQAQELEQLKLDLEKLAQFKLMLSQAKSGYQSLTNGYNGVINTGKENFVLHKQQLDQLLTVSQPVKNSPVAEQVFQRSLKITSDSKSLVAWVKQSGVFTPDEISNLSKLIGEIGETVSADTELLNTVLSNGKLRMTDAERSRLIDNIDRTIKNQMIRLKQLEDDYNKTLALRMQNKRDINSLKQLSNIH